MSRGPQPRRHFGPTVWTPTRDGASRVAFGHRPQHLHGVPERDLGEGLRVDLPLPSGLAQLLEVADHRRGRVKVQLPTGGVADPETMGNSSGDEDERSRGTGQLATI